jgi:Condensation domain
VDLDALAPLSVAQEALWYQSVLFPQEVIYNEIASIRHDGPLEAGPLHRALEEIVARYEILRTTFDVLDGNPVQVVHPAAPLPMPVIDLSALEPGEAEARAAQLIAEVARVPYDVRRGPLLRPRLIVFPGEHQRLYLAMHHIIFDGVCLARAVVPEIAVLYDAFAAGRPSPLDTVPVQYGEFARREQEQIASPRAARRLDYWRGHLADAPALTLIPDRPRSTTPQFRGRSVGWEATAEDVARLRAVAAASGGSLFMALGAAWGLLLARWAGQEEVVFGTPADLRSGAEFVSLVGYCLTPLVLRVSLEGDPGFGEVVRRVRNDVLDALDHMIPFERIVRELHPETDRSITPVYQTMLALEPASPDPASGWSLRLADAFAADELGSTRMDLELQIDERPDGHLEGRLIYDRDLFDRETVVRLGEHLSRLVAAVGEDPELPVSQVPLLTAEQERRQAIIWNATETSVDGDGQTVAELIAQRAAEARRAGGGGRRADGLPCRAAEPRR